MGLWALGVVCLSLGPPGTPNYKLLQIAFRVLIVTSEVLS